MGDEVESFVIGNKVCEFITMRIVRMAYNQTKALRLIFETCNHRLYFKKFSKYNDNKATLQSRRLHFYFFEQLDSDYVTTAHSGRIELSGS